MEILSVTFDSNVWENIVDDNKRLGQKIYEDIFIFINNGQIEPFIFEGIVTLENILRKNRKEYFGNFEGSYKIKVDDEDAYERKGTKPAELTGYLSDIIPKAINMGFKFIQFPRIGMPGINYDEKYCAADKIYDLKNRIQRSFDCSDYIESLGAGKARLDNLLKNGKHTGFIELTKINSSLNPQKYADEIGEWVDGDALSAHYGYGINYFCTNDKAGASGGSSIFSSSNKEKLNNRYGINIISPQKLIDIINS